MAISDLSARTLRLDVARSIPAGVVETMGTTFAILIAVRHFGLPATTKAVLVASSAAGFLGSLFVLPLVNRLGWKTPRAAAGLWSLAALAFASVFLAGRDPGVFVVASVLGAFLPPLAIPLLTQVLNSNYGPARRGRWFALASMARMATAMVAALAIGRWLDHGITGFPWLFLLYALCALAVAVCLWHLDGGPPSPGKPPLLGAFRHVNANRPFRKLLLVWMLLGFGNLISVALFVEFAANPAHGLNLSSTTVGALTGTLPVGCAMASIFLWGWLFDRAHFYRVRGFINVLFVIASVCYFAGGSLPWMIAGMTAHGLARAGGDVSWNLWVTKFAREDEVAEYMSVHAFLTGLRGLIAPFLGFYLLDHLSPPRIAMICATLILAGTAIILPEILDRHRHLGGLR